MKLRPVYAAVLLALSSLSMAAFADDVRRPYIVQLADKPVASYTGGVNGIAATQPSAGARLDLESGDVQLYSDYLDQKQATVQAAIAGAPILYNYSVVMNGFAAMLTDAEVRTLKARSDVASIEADVPRTLNTTYTAGFLGLDKADGLWSKLGGKRSAGEDIIIGIVDGGVWPESMSYADRVDANGKPTFDTNAELTYTAPPSVWKGICQTGEAFTVAHCNNKLIGAQYFDATFKSTTNTTHWTEFRSPRDSIGGSYGHGGHGTHTSTTAGGNAGAQAVISGVPVGETSGMAPRARISSYKVCWTYNLVTEPTGGKNSCYTGDSVKAIEQAVKDGVHVINFSISGGTSITDPVEQAFLNAANAGVFVAASAGNSGPANEVAHISPWLTTVAASTHNRLLKAGVQLGSGATFSGASMNQTALAPTAMIRAQDAGLAGADPTKLSLCYAKSDNAGVAVLDPAKVAGKVVTCERGVTARVDKSKAVFEAGGAGMVLIDNGAGLVAEVHSVPTVHVNSTDGGAIRTYAATAGSTASIGTFSIGSSAVPAPVVANFSSRGPNRFDANVMKPDMTAPGVDIIAGVTPGMTESQRSELVNGSIVPAEAFAAYQGTSMSSPHVAGLAALLKQQHPTWSPAAIKSALMTTGTMTFANGLLGASESRTPWSQGAGHVNPNGASDPGLVYDLTQLDYKKYQCGAGIAAQCSNGTMFGYNLNLPSITVGNVLGTVTVTRTVKNVTTMDATYNAAISVPGYTATVTPSTLSIPAGQSKSFNVTLQRNGSPDNEWQYGALTWTDGTHVVRSPVNARSGKPITAPSLITSDKTAATRIMSVSTGFSGKMNTVYGGLTAVSKTAYTLPQAAPGSVDSLAQIQAACRAGLASKGIKTVSVTIPAGAVAASFETFDRDTASGGGDDLDLALLNSAGNLVATALHAGSNEAIVLPSPAPGTYKVCVINYAAANNVSTTFDLSRAVVTSTSRYGNFKAMVPATVYAGSTASVSVSWSGLAAGKRYLGGVQLLDLSGAPASTTLVRVETNNPIPLGEPVLRQPKRDNGI